MSRALPPAADRTWARAGAGPYRRALTSTADRAVSRVPGALGSGSVVLALAGAGRRFAGLRAVVAGSAALLRRR